MLWTLDRLPALALGALAVVAIWGGAADGPTRRQTRVPLLIGNVWEWCQDWYGP